MASVKTNISKFMAMLAVAMLCLPYSPALAEDGATLVQAQSATVETIDSGKYSTGDHVAIPDSNLYCTVKNVESHTLTIGGNESTPVVNLGSSFPVHAGNGLTEYPSDHKVVIPATAVDSDGAEWTIVEIAAAAFMAADNNNYINDVVIEGNIDTIGDFAFAGLMGGQHTPSFKFEMANGSSVNEIAASAFNYVETDDLEFPEGSKITLVTDSYGTANNRAYYTHCNAIGAKRIIFPKSYSGQIYQCSSKHSTRLVNSSGMVTPQLGIVAVLSPYATFVCNGLANATGTLTKAPTSFDIVSAKRPDDLSVLVWGGSPAETSLSNASELAAGYSKVLHMAVLRDGFTVEGVVKPTESSETYGAQNSNVRLNNSDEGKITSAYSLPEKMLSVIDSEGNVEWTLEEGVDYEVKYYASQSASEPLSDAPIVAGTYWVEFVGNEKTAWGTTPRYELTLTESKTALDDVDVTVSTDEQVYDGTEKEPAVTVKHGESDLVQGVDYEIEYIDNLNAGEAKLVVTGKGAYCGTVEKPFSIAKAQLEGATVTFTGGAVYCGTEIKLTPTVKIGSATVSSDAYDVAYANNVDAGPATVTVTAKEDGNYSGSAIGQFEVQKANLSGVTIESLFTGVASNGNTTFDTVNNKVVGETAYTGFAIEPEIPQLISFVNYATGQVRYDVQASDYTTEGWTDNTTVGEAVITLNGQGNFTGSVTLKHAIVQASVENVEATIEDQAWTGGAIEPKPVVKLGEYTLDGEVDYDIVYDPIDLTDVGLVTATITGKGNFKDSKMATFRIRKSIEGAEVQVADQVYTGQELKPEVAVRLGDSDLVPEQDYTVAYESNVNVGTATVTVTGQDNYMGTATGTFQIKASADDQAAVDAAVDTINAIGAVTAGSKAAVEAARAAYQGLTDLQKSLVSDEAVKVLEDAEAAYAKAADEKAKADADAKAKSDAAAAAKAALAAASNVNKASFTAADAKKASDLGATTITLGPKVKKIAKGAFKGTKIKTIIVKTKKLKKKSVKGAFKGSKVNTVKVQVGSKKVNKKYVKKYKKIFTKKNAGKKAKVK